MCLFAVREIIKSGEIGEVKAVQVSFGFFNPGTVERLVNPDLGAGAILGKFNTFYCSLGYLHFFPDIGVYGVAFASMVFGECSCFPFIVLVAECIQVARLNESLP